LQPIDPCYNPTIRTLARRVLPLVYRGSAVACPCCGGTFRKFIARYGNDSLCPACLSLGRHRALSMFLAEHLARLDRETTLLHFAPEEGLAARVRSLPNVRYVSADIDPRAPTSIHFDITAIPFENSSFDVIICSHVLEHVSDDRLAMRELRRVLRPSGVLYSMHPVYHDLAVTLEDPNVTDPAERRRRFGQFDHVRKYGRDFPDRLRDEGFDVDVVDYTAGLEADRRTDFGLTTGEQIFVCRPSRLAATR
jgi:SAM-dependent methyltransferase